MPFVLFGTQHLITLIVSFLIIGFVPYIASKKSAEEKHIFAVSIGVLLFVHEVMQVFHAFSFGLAWYESLPLHMCDLSATSIAIYLIYRKPLFFNIAFFWGSGGALIAMITPDLSLGFPDGLYVPFFYGHAMTILGIVFGLSCLKVRPFFRDYILVTSLTAVSAVFIYVINLMLGSNFWYLNRKPQVATVLDFFPDPPIHLLILVPLVIFVFFITYAPFLILDRTKS
jgi:hypothetical integral membrane protein (TIGR02206 family)